MAVTNFRIQWATDAGFTQNVGSTIVGNVTSHTVTGLSPETPYYFRVAARDAQGNEGAISDTANATTDVASGSVWPTMSPSYLPIVRNMAGPGLDTPAGFGRAVSALGLSARNVTIRRVTSLSGGTGDGTLREAIADHNGQTGGASVIVFDVSGTIDFESTTTTGSGVSADVNRSFLTIAGQTAPSPGVQVINGRIRIRASHVLVQHLAVRQLNAPDPIGGVYDAMNVETSGSAEGALSHVVFDHCAAQWGLDGVFDLTGYNGAANNISLTNCIIGEGVGIDTGGSDDDHRYAMLLAGIGDIMLHGCLFINGKDRHPLSRARNIAFVNSVIYNWTTAGMKLQAPDYSYAEQPSNTNVEGCYFKLGPSSVSALPIALTTLVPPVNSKLYVSDCKYISETGTDITQADQYNLLSGQGSAPSGFKATSRVYWPADLVADTADNTRANIISFCGPRPGARDSDAARVIGEFQSDNGRLKKAPWYGGTVQTGDEINHITLASNTSTFPASPPSGGSWNDVVSGGYTKIEEYLHSLEDAIL